MAKNDALSSEAEHYIKILRNDLVDIQGFIAQEFVKITAQSGGEIDVNNKDIKAAANSLINADPMSSQNRGKAVLSFTATEQGIKEKINKIIRKNNIPKELFKNFLQEIDQLKNDLKNKVSTNEGLKDLITNRIKTQLIANNINLFDQDKNGELTMLRKESKADVVSKLAPLIDLPEKLIKDLLVDNKDKKQKANSIINDQIIGSFSKLQGNANVLDRAKITPETIKRTSREISRKMSVESFQARALIEQAITNISDKDNIKFTPERREKIMKYLLPKVAEFGGSYIENQQVHLISNIEKSLKSKQTLFSKVFGNIFGNGFSISSKSLDKIASKLETEHRPLVRQDTIKNIEKSIVRNAMSDSIIAEKLNSFAKDIGQKATFTKNNVPSSQDIAELRSQDSKKFDQIFNTATPTKSVTKSVTKAATKAVTKSVTKKLAKKVPSMHHHTSTKTSPTRVTGKQKVNTKKRAR